MKKGQVTLFVILGIMIVSVILIFFLWVQPTYFSDTASRSGFEGCVADVVEETILDLEGSAGYIEPEFTYAYNGEELVYLCYTNAYYETCTVQRPFLKQDFDKSIESQIKGAVDNCYSNSFAELKNQGYSVKEGAVEYDVLIEPGVVRVEIDAPTTVGTQKFARFNVQVNSPIYEMVMMATSILQFEVRYGDSDIDSLVAFYPDYVIDKLKQGDGTTVYILENKITGDRYPFASRSLAWPPGYLR